MSVKANSEWFEIYLLLIFTVPEKPDKEEKMKIPDESLFLKSLEGFLLVLSPEGDFVFLSDNVSEYLGITQVRLACVNF